jgi:hypothetical protein
VKLLPAAILAASLMFFLGWWVGRLQREAERAKYYDPIAGTYHDGTAWPMRHATGGNSPYVEDDDGVQPWDPPIRMAAMPADATPEYLDRWKAAWDSMPHSNSLRLADFEDEVRAAHRLVRDEPGGGW